MLGLYFSIDFLYNCADFQKNKSNVEGGHTMWETVSGYCPVHQQEMEISVEFVRGTVIDGKPQFKAGGYKCSADDSTNPTCSHCPIALTAHKP